MYRSEVTVAVEPLSSSKKKGSDHPKTAHSTPKGEVGADVVHGGCLCPISTVLFINRTAQMKMSLVVQHYYWFIFIFKNGLYSLERTADIV